MEEGKPFQFPILGPLPVPDPTYMGGVGNGTSFAPMVDSVPKSRIPRRGLLASLSTAPAPSAFAILSQVASGGGTPTVQVGVYFYSKLLGLFYDSTTAISIIGLLSQYPPSTSDSAWVTAAAGQKVYLEMAISAGAVSTAHLKIDTSYSGGTWTTGGDTENDGGSPPSQTYARKLIGTIDAVAAPSLSFTQEVFTSLGMMSCCINGEYAIYPVPI